MSKNSRLDKLEAKTQSKDMTVVFLSWEEGVIVDGEQMTQGEFYKLYPGYEPDKEINLKWDFDD